MSMDDLPACLSQTIPPSTINSAEENTFQSSGNSLRTQVLKDDSTPTQMESTRSKVGSLLAKYNNNNSQHIDDLTIELPAVTLSQSNNGEITDSSTVVSKDLQQAKDETKLEPVIVAAVTSEEDVTLSNVTEDSAKPNLVTSLKDDRTDLLDSDIHESAVSEQGKVEIDSLVSPTLEHLSDSKRVLIVNSDDESTDSVTPTNNVSCEDNSRLFNNDTDIKLECISPVNDEEYDWKSMQANANSLPDLTATNSNSLSCEFQQNPYFPLPNPNHNLSNSLNHSNKPAENNFDHLKIQKTSQKLFKKEITADTSAIFAEQTDLPSLACGADALFCLTCHERVTSDLTHSRHETVEVSTAIANQHMECESLLDTSAKCLASAGRWSEHITTLRSELVKDRKAIAVELDEMFRELELRLQERKMVLFTQLTDCSYHKECCFDDHLLHMNTIQDQLSSRADGVNKIKRELNETSRLANHCEELKEAAEEIEQHTVKLNSFSVQENTCLQFDRKGVIEVRKALNNLASVTSSHVIPSKCTASGDGLKKAHVHKQTFVKVIPRNGRGQIEREKGLMLQAHFYNEEINVECQCIDNGNGTYNILYIAPETGTYHLAIKLFKQHINGSPFKVEAVAGSRVTFSRGANSYELARVQQHHNVNSHSVLVSKHSANRTPSPRSLGSAESYSSLKILPASPSSHNSANSVQPPYGDYLAVIGQFGRRKGDFSNPQGVTVDHNHRIYCTDSSNQIVQVFTDTGSYLNCVGKRGRQLGQVLRPIGICCSKDGLLIFTDYENKCINVFKDGEFVRRIGQGKLIGPKGITTTPRGSIIVADNKGNQVLEFSINGRLIRKIQSQSKDKASQFAGPHYVTVNEQGDIYVSDFHNHCIKIFSKEGVYQGAFGNHGSGNGQFNAPTGVTIDQQGHILVSDWGNSRIQIFDAEGCFLAHVDTSAAPLFGPQSICAIRDHKVIVADSGNHCVKIFRYDTS